MAKGMKNHEKDGGYPYFPSHFVPSKVARRLTGSDILTPGGVGMTGEKLRDRRMAKCLTQRQLGELLGYSGRSAENVVQNWEYDKQPIPIKHWRKLSKVLGIDLEDFLPPEE